MKLSEHEEELLRMVAGIDPWPHQPFAWVNACMEFLQDDGYVTRSGKLTHKGRLTLGLEDEDGR